MGDAVKVFSSACKCMEEESGGRERDRVCVSVCVCVLRGRAPLLYIWRNRAQVTYPDKQQPKAAAEKASTRTHTFTRERERESERELANKYVLSECVRVCVCLFKKVFV